MVMMMTRTHRHEAAAEAAAGSAVDSSAIHSVRVGGWWVLCEWVAFTSNLHGPPTRTAASPDSRTVGLDQTARRVLTNRSTTARMSVTQQVGGPKDGERPGSCLISNKNIQQMTLVDYEMEIATNNKRQVCRN